MTAGTRRVGVKGQRVLLAKHRPGEPISGRIDWKINYGALIEGEDIDLSHSLLLRGAIEAHCLNGAYIAGGHQTPA